MTAAASALKQQATVHVPVLRAGRMYESAETLPIADIRTGETLGVVGQANAGLIRRDLRRSHQAAVALRALPARRLIEITQEAGRRFMEDDLCVGIGDGDQTQGPEEYVRTLSATSGLPHHLVRANMDKIALVCRQMDRIVGALTRGLNLSILDEAVGEHDGVPMCFYPAADALGVILPSNSPGVNSLWLPAIALKTPVCLKPGREEPWTPWRIVQAFIAAGCPAEAFSFYPTAHDGAAEILKLCGRSLLFGDASTTAPWADDPRVQVHGPGRTKIIIGLDLIDRWREWLDVLIESALRNGGRSCVNVSTVVVPKHGRVIAEALAERLGPLSGSDPDDDSAALAAFANPAVAERIDAAIAAGLKAGGAEDITTAFRQGERLQRHGGATFLRPTVLLCNQIDHPLANVEYPFVFVSVVEIPQDEVVAAIGPTLAVTAITEDDRLQADLLRAPHIDRLNLGPIPTTEVKWDQPHEGNLFELLYRRRAIQVAKAR